MNTMIASNKLASGPALVSRQSPARRVAQVVRANPDPFTSDPKTTPTGDDVVGYAKSLPGITAPFPNMFDPANLLGNAGSSNKGSAEVKRWRESELTHGRVAMLASLGFIVQEQIQEYPSLPFPHVKGPAITHFQQVEAKGARFWEPLVLAIGIAEAYRVAVGWKPPSSENFYALYDEYKPGALGFDPLGLYPEDPAEQYEIETKELNNGRLAMIAIAGFVGQELKTGQPLSAGWFATVEGKPNL